MVSDIDDVRTYFLVIKIYQAKKNYAGIVEACEAIIRIQPENVEAIKHLSEAKNFLSSPDALDVLGKYLEIAEFNEEEWFRAARKFYNIGSYETVISLLSQMDGKTVGMENVRELRAMIFLFHGNVEEVLR